MPGIYRLLRMLGEIAVVSLPLAAQTAGGGRHRFGVDLGLMRTDDRDESVSPLRFHGMGPGTGLTYERETRSSRASFGITLGKAQLRSVRAVNPSSTADNTRLGAELSFLRAVGRSRGDRLRVFAGGVFDGAVDGREARYSFGETRSYLSGVVSVAPAVLLEFDARPTRTVSYRLSVPVATGVIHSYADTQVLDNAEERRLHWTGPPTFRAVQQTLTYTASLSAHTAFRGGLRVNLFDYDRAPHLAGERSFASVGVIWWTRGADR